MHAEEENATTDEDAPYEVENKDQLVDPREAKSGLNSRGNGNEKKERDVEKKKRSKLSVRSGREGET